jgi:hypothetical protein
MKPLRRAFAALERRPWPLAIFAGLGFTLLVASAIALLGSPELLDTLVALGDAKLYGSLALLFVASAGAARIAFRRRRRLEEDLDDIVLAVPAAVPPADKPAKASLR